ncbi:ST3 beta-galactoside alpha-2,3-sialyltransferase 7 [Latimeria chalumnae]|uniref:ST3 beta-galactoside alpha-2,3-sialyltransferase 7 n=1 Tax=Latimeria chalumnae TaxID=7897 RepID=UPI00313B4B65
MMDRRMDEPFTFSRRWNLLTSILLLFCGYAALLYPPYCLDPQDIWKRYTLEPRRIQALHNQTAVLLSRPCQAQFSQRKLSELYPGKVPRNLSVFVEAWEPEGSRYRPPFGFRGCEEELRQALAVLLPVTRLPSSQLPAPACRRCVVVGSAGILHGSRLGAYIDQHDIIIRLNNGPVIGFEEDVGHRTSIRVTYPEGAPKSPQEYDPSSLFALAMYKSMDLTWLSSVVQKKALGLWTKLWFWQSVVEFIPLCPKNFRILNLEIIRETALEFLGYPEPQDSPFRINQMVPTLGVSAVVMATHLCDEVSLAGFGYDLSRPQAPLHYFETVHMDAINAQAMHNVDTEKLFLAALVKAGAVNDLTGGICW